MQIIGTKPSIHCLPGICKLSYFFIQKLPNDTLHNHCLKNKLDKQLDKKT